MLNFLAVTSFADYEDLATNLVVKSRWENPFSFDKLATGESYFFPIVEHRVMIAVWMVLVAALFLWYISNVNRSDLYILAAIGLAICGLDFSLGFNTLYPSVLAMVGACAAIYFVFVSIVTFFTVVAVNYLPYLYIGNQYLFNKDGEVRKRVLLGSSLFTFALFWYLLSLSPVELFIRGSLGASPFWYWVEAFLMIVTGAYAANLFLPWKVLERKENRFDYKDVKQIREPFIIDDDKDRAVTVKKLVEVGVLILFGYVFSFVFLKDSSDLTSVDLGGFIMLIAMCMLLGRAIIYKFNHQQYLPWENSQTDIKALKKNLNKKKKKHKNPWTDSDVSLMINMEK